MLLQSYYKSVSSERLDLLDGDVMFMALDAGTEEPFAKFRKDPCGRS